MIKIILARLVESSLNKLLALDMNAYSSLETHVGKVIKINMSDLKQQLFFVIRHQYIFVYTLYNDNIATTITGSSFAFMKQIKSTSLNELIIEGDIDLAHDIQRLIRNLDFQGEEFFSYFIGDFAVTQVGNFCQRLHNNIKHIKTRSIEDCVEFLQEERHFLPCKEEVEDHYDDLIELRNKIEQLDARWNRLMEKK